MKIYLSPSNQPANLYAVGNTSEKEQMEAVALLVQNKLKEYEVETVMADFNKSINKSERPTDAAKSKCDFYLAIHSNATGSTPTATGSVGIYHPNSAISKQLAEELVMQLDSICPIKSNRYTKLIDGMAVFNGSGYGEIRSPYSLGIPSIIVEVNFHDNPKTAQYIIDNKDGIADAIVRGLVKVFKLQKKAVEESEGTDMKEIVYNTLDEVPEYAKSTIKKLIEKGYLNGDGKGNYSLTLDMIRVFVVHDRLGIYDR